MNENPLGPIRIDRVVEELDVWLGNEFPFAKMKVKVVDSGPGGYVAFTNLRFRNPKNGACDGQAGLGDTPKKAVDDLLTRF